MRSHAECYCGTLIVLFLSLVFQNALANSAKQPESLDSPPLPLTFETHLLMAHSLASHWRTNQPPVVDMESCANYGEGTMTSRFRAEWEFGKTLADDVEKHV